MKREGLKTLDVFAYALLIIGALNWGLTGLFAFNLVAFLFGEMTALTRLVYMLVGAAALYDIIFAKAIWHRWGASYHPFTHHHPKHTA